MTLKSVARHSATVLIILVTVLCIFTPDLVFLRQYAGYTLYLMLGLLGFGFLCFVFNDSHLMMVSLLCCCGLSLYLKDSSNQKIRLATVTSNPALRVSHISLGNAEADYDAVIDYLLGINADFLSVQELTPDWNEHLIERLTPQYHYVQTLTRIDQYGMGFFSKLPFQQLDTFYFQEIPNLAATVLLDGSTCKIISCQLMPPVNESAFAAIDQHFRLVSDYVDTLHEPTVVLGDFHLPPWSAEVQRFRTNSHLQDGRRDIHPRNIDGSLSLPRIPVEHILYSDDFDCTAFSDIGNAMVGRLGITGTYQLQLDHEAMVQ